MRWRWKRSSLEGIILIEVGLSWVLVVSLLLWVGGNMAVAACNLNDRSMSLDEYKAQPLGVSVFFEGFVGILLGIEGHDGMSGGRKGHMK
jgi:hypothetical protein